MSNSTDTAVKSAKNGSNGNGKAATKPEQTPKAPTREDVAKLIGEEIQKAQRKSELISHRERFLTTKARLQVIRSEHGADFDEHLDSMNLRVILTDVNGRGGDAVSISNNMVVADFISYAINRIDQKVLEIEKEILG